MTWMRDLLEAAASRIQVVVMTCDPEHYALENGRLAEAPALLIMELSGLHDAGRLSRSDFVACLELIVSYLMRRAACGLQTRGYWSIFARLAYELARLRLRPTSM